MGISDVVVGRPRSELRLDDGADRHGGGEPAGIELLEPFLALVPDAAVVVDATGRIVCANEQVAVLFGRAPGELAGQPIEVLIPERFCEHHGHARAVYAGAPQARAMGAGLELRGRRRDGTEFPLDISLAPFAGPDGPLVVAAIRDATQGHAAVAAQAQLAAIVASSMDGIVSIGMDGRITTWNPGAERLLGYASVEVVGRHVSLLVPEDATAGLDDLLAAALAGRTSAPRDTQWLRGDGTRLDVAVSVSPLRDGAAAPIGSAAIVRDITERRRAEAELAQAQLAHEELSVMVDRERIARDLHHVVIQRLFAAGMGLVGVRQFITDPRAGERVSNTVAELDATIRDIRSTIFALNRPAVATPGLRSALIRLAGEVAGALGFEPGLRFEGPVDTAVPPELVSDALIVAREALWNAARRAGSRSVELELSVGDELVLIVIDDGVGLAGTDPGSGLASLGRRAEGLGGSFGVTSSPQGGTRIEWRVPVAR